MNVVQTARLLLVPSVLLLTAALVVSGQSCGQTVEDAYSQTGFVNLASVSSDSPPSGKRTHGPACIPDDNLCSRGCSPVEDSDCEILRRVELMERFLKAHRKGNLYTPDPREGSLEPRTEVYRLLFGSQALGYIELYRATGKRPYLRDGSETLTGLLGLDTIWAASARDGDVALAFLEAYELTGNREFYEHGIAAARRLADFCEREGPRGNCELNWGLSAALCFAQAYRLTGDASFLDAARPILARTQVYQHLDGSLPHQSDLRDRNLEYSSWVAFQLLTYLTLDPGAATSDTAVTYYGRKVTLDVGRLLHFLVGLLERQITSDGEISYTARAKVPGPCTYCANPQYPRCREYCASLCESADVQSAPCECVANPLYDCPIAGAPAAVKDSGEPDPLCVYCIDQMYAACAAYCRNVCGRDSTEFPCYCISDLRAQCPNDSVWVETAYNDDRDTTYETRGWTSELASTAFALAKAGRHQAKWKVLNFLFSLQNEDGSFPDKWGFRTEVPGTRSGLWAGSEHSVIRTSVIFRVLASLLVASPDSRGSSLPASSGNLEIGSMPGTLVLTSVFPNPTVSGMTVRFALPTGTGEAELVIADAAGRTVRRLPRVRLDQDGASLTWDGTDDGGSRVAPGVYFAQVLGSAWRSGRKLVVLGP